MKKILYNANVITMEDELYSEAILIENGIIKGVGTNEEILDKKEENTEVIDMNKKTILPALLIRIVIFQQLLIHICNCN